MLTSIIQSLSTGLGDLLEYFMNMFLNALGMNLSSYLDVFPLLATVYTLLRSFSVGMIVIVAGVSLATFWFGTVEGSAKDRPSMVLIRSFFAVLAVYWGGHVLEYIVHLGSIPYDQFLHLNAVSLSTGSFSWKDFLGGMLTETSGIGLAVLGDLAVSMLTLLITIIIGWNLFKLVIEVCERWLIVGVLVFSSPIVYCTIPSANTSRIFRNWVSMFVGSVIQMSLSVMFLKLILSGFNAQSNVPFIMKMFMVLAMCKIAQRVDTYLQQIGVGVATTGGNMIDDMIAGAKALGMTRPSSKKGVLGGIAGGAGTPVLRGRTSLTRGISAAVSKYRSGGSVGEAARTGAAATARNWQERTGLGRAYQAYNRMKNRPQAQAASSVKTGSSGGTVSANEARTENAQRAVQRKGAAKTFAKEYAKGTAAGFGMAVAPNLVGDHDSSIVANEARAAEKNEQKAERLQQEQEREQKRAAETEVREAENAAKTSAEAVADMQKEFHSGGAPMPDDVREAAEQARNENNYKGLRNFNENYNEYGAKDKDGNVLNLAENGDVVPSVEAAASGVSINDDNVMTDKCGGKAVSEWMASSIGKDDINPDGTNSFAALPARDAYINQNIRPDSEYEAEGLDAANQERDQDEKTVSSYEKSMPGIGQATADLTRAEEQTTALRRSGAGYEMILAAESRADTAREAVYEATAAAGEKQVSAAKQKLDAMDASGLSHESAGYQAAQKEYQQKSEALDNYKMAYDNISGDRYKSRVEEGEQFVAGARANMESLAASGVSTDSKEYQTAQRDYEQKKQALDDYKAAYAAKTGIRHPEIVSVKESRVAEAKTVLDQMESNGTAAAARSYQAAKANYEQKQQRLDELKTDYAAKTDSGYPSRLSALEKETAEAKSKVDKLESSGAGRSSVQYQAAKDDYSRKQQDLDTYKAEHSAAGIESHYDRTARRTASANRESDRRAAGETYDEAQKTVVRLLNNSIDQSDAFVKARALNNPNFTPADNAATRRVAYGVFRDAIPDMKPGTVFSSVAARDIKPRSDNAAKLEMNGGRMYEVRYTRNDDSEGRMIFYNGVASRALPPQFAKNKGVYTDASGGHWLTSNPEHRTAIPSGRRTVETRSLTAFFAAIRKRKHR